MDRVVVKGESDPRGVDSDTRLFFPHPHTLLGAPRLPFSRGRRASSIPQDSSNRIQDLVSRIEYLVIGEAQHQHSGACQESVALPILCWRPKVVGSVRLPSKPSLLAVEVSDVRTKRMLPAELVAVQSASPQSGPKQLFGGRGCAPQRACTKGHVTKDLSHAR
jgi:hypothetical protein